jgi:hypothetical protein
MNPLITFRLDRRRLLAAAAVTVAVAGPGRRLAMAAQTPAASPASPSGDPAAVALLQEAARTMAALQTFHFESETTQGSSTILEGLELEGIVGDVRRPMDFRTVITAGVPFGSIDVTVVGVEGRIWITDPLAAEESWILLADGSAGGGEAAEITTLANPDALILEAVSVLRDARIGGQEKIDGVETTRVDGQVDLAAAAQQAVGTPVDLPPEVSTEPIPVSIWIDEGRRMLEVELAGPLLASESADVVRIVRFSAFDEPVDIAPPENAPQ